MPATTRPHGQITRGKTALNRLRQVDVFVGLAHRDALVSGAPLVVDLGFGAQAWTTLEMRDRWLRHNPNLRVIGLEIDPERVRTASAFADPPAVDFRLGGFDLERGLLGERARVVRCFNVLRQYDESAVREALSLVAAGIEPGGLLVEGTSDPTGRMVAFDTYRRRGPALEHESLVFGTNFRDSLDPRDLQTILPKRLIHRMLDEAPARFFSDWRHAWELARGLGHTTAREQWVCAARMLRERFGHAVDVRDRILERGFVVLRDDLADGPASLRVATGRNP